MAHYKSAESFTRQINKIWHATRVTPYGALLSILLFSVPVCAGSGTDNFSRSDNLDLGAAWDSYTNNSVDSPCQILNGATNGYVTATSGGGLDCVEGYNAYIPGNDQYVQVSLPLGFLSPGSQFASVLLRLAAPTTYSGYVFRAQPPDQVNTSRLRKATAGTMTTLVNDTTQTWAATDILRGEASSTTLTLKRNGTQIIQTTDGTYGSGRGGINVLDDPSGVSNPVDDFEVGDLGGGVTRRPVSPMVFR